MFAQVPGNFDYQAIVNDVDGNPLVNQDLKIKASIYTDSPGGALMYQESHEVTTDENGLLAVAIGSGQLINGSVQTIASTDTNVEAYYLTIEMDPGGGNNYQLIGTNKLHAIPFALHSQNALHVENTAFAQQTDRAILASMVDTASVTWMSLNDNDADPTNEIQELVYDPITNTLSISGRNSVLIDVNDADSDPNNEIQELSYENNVLTLSNQNGSASTADLNGCRFTAPGASVDFPCGLFGEYILWQGGINIVPNGKTLFILSADFFIKLPQFNIDHTTAPNMPVFTAGTIVEDCNCTGILMDDNDDITPITIDFSGGTGSFIVPIDQTLFIKSGLKYNAPIILVVNGSDLTLAHPNDTNGNRIITFPAGTRIEPFNSEASFLTGYLYRQ